MPNAAPPRDGAALVTAVAADVAAGHLEARFAGMTSSGVVVAPTARFPAPACLCLVLCLIR